MNSGAKKHVELNIFVRCALILFIVASFAISVNNLMRYNDYRDKIDDLKIKELEYEERIERIEYQLQCEFDDEYVIKLAKEKLNLCMPGESVYYNGLD